MSKAIQIANRGPDAVRKAIQDAHEADSHPCEYGHICCSAYEGGPCIDELSHYDPDDEQEPV